MHQKHIIQMLLMKVLMILEGKMTKLDLLVIIMSELAFFKCWGKQRKQTGKKKTHDFVIL